MATVFTANSSGIQVDGQPVEGVRGIEYQHDREQTPIHALGTEERIAVYYGASAVQGRLRVASASPSLDALAASGASFQVIANLRHGETTRSVAFDDCFMVRKDFSMAAGGHAETVYLFTATRVREE